MAVVMKFMESLSVALPPSLIIVVNESEKVFGNSYDMAFLGIAPPFPSSTTKPLWCGIDFGRSDFEFLLLEEISIIAVVEGKVESRAFLFICR